MGVAVSAYIQHFSYLGLFVVLVMCGLGLPVPEDVALLAGGFMVHRGITAYPATIAVALVGVVAGDNSLFLIGRRFGSGLLSYFGVARPKSRRRIERMRQFMERHGSKAIFYARFFAGLRAIVYLSAGSLGVSPGRFFLYDLLGALISVPLMVSAGYFFGSEIELAIKYVGGFEHVLLLILAASILFWVTRYFYLVSGRSQETE
ncbi:MAG TPA: DedA family protein [Candidatus Binataceae bacterium]|nr:DedA family protein [Candidatus Binataceae bacterium]